MILDIILYTLLFFVVMVGVPLTITFILYTFRYFIKIYTHRCRFCNHKMEYKGLKGDGDSAHYLFHCRHCGAWQQIKHRDFFNEL